MVRFRSLISKSASLVSLVLLCLAVSVATANTVSAAPNRYTVAHPSHAIPMSCYVTVVYLHGKNPPTVTCPVKDKPAQGKHGPYTQQYSCGPNLPRPWVAFYQDADYGGAQICFVARGFINLTDFYIFYPFESWNDQVSSFNMGAYGVMYKDINSEGDQCDYYVGEEYAYIDDACGSGWNDTLSSFEILG